MFTCSSKTLIIYKSSNQWFAGNSDFLRSRQYVRRYAEVSEVSEEMAGKGGKFLSAYLHEF